MNEGRTDKYEIQTEAQLNRDCCLIQAEASCIRILPVIVQPATRRDQQHRRSSAQRNSQLRLGWCYGSASQKCISGRHSSGQTFLGTCRHSLSVSAISKEVTSFSIDTFRSSAGTQLGAEHPCTYRNVVQHKNRALTVICASAAPSTQSPGVVASS